MQIRRANELDLIGINKLLRQVLEVHAAGRPDIFIGGRKKYTDDELLEILADDTTPVFAAVDDDNSVLGYAFCVYQITQNDNILCDRRVIYIDDLCVDENCRGKHIGTQLFEYVKSFAQDNGFDAITLNVWAFNENALRFYEKCGFSPLKHVMEMKM